MSQIRGLIAWGRRSLACSALGLLVLSPPLAAQDDSVPVGPPPHFVAGWAPPGTMIDVSRMGTLRKRVTLALSNVPIDTAIAAIMNRAELKLFYRADLLPAGRTVSIQAVNITAASALAEVLLDTGFDVLMDKDDHLYLVQCTHLVAGAVRRDSSVVAGRVTDRFTNAPLSGAVVMIKGTRFSATANAEGRYRLAGVPAGSYAVTVRYIGYAPMSATVIVGTKDTVQDFALPPSAQPLEQVVVTGTLAPTKVKALPAPITIITADDIRRQHVTRLAQLFRGQDAGVLAWDRPADDHYNTINIRGVTSFSTRAVKTFIDGIEVADPQFTALIDPNSIERIELTRGPQASTMYGSDALSGVLQIFTKKGAFRLSRPEGEFKTSASLIEKAEGAGVAPRLEDAVMLRGSEQHTRYQAAATYRHDGEWTPSYRNTNWNATASAENVQGPLTSQISAMFARKVYDRAWFTALRDAGYPSFSVPPFETIELQTQTYGINFTYVPTPWWRHDLVLGYDRWAFGDVQTRRRFTTPADTLLQVIMNQRSKMSVFYYNTVSVDLGNTIGATFTTGFNHYHLDGSDAFSPSSTKNAGTLTGPTTLLRLSSANTGYFAQAQVNVAETAFLTAGVRAERSSGFGEAIGTVVSPRFGTAYVRSIGPVTAKLRASYGESIRAAEQSQNQAFVTAEFERLHNPALRPERQRGSDGGVDVYWGARASLSATYYNQKAIDLIDQVPLGTAGDPPRGLSQQQNVGRIQNRGWEFEARYGAARWQLSGAFSTMRSRIRQIDAAYSGDYQVGDRLFDVPRYTAGLTATYSPIIGTSLHGGMTSVGHWVERDLVAFYGSLFGEVSPGDASSRPSGRDYWIDYPGFTKFRIGVEQTFRRKVTAAFDVENVTNQRAFEADNLAVPAPRLFTVALRVSY